MDSLDIAFSHPQVMSIELSQIKQWSNIFFTHAIDNIKMHVYTTHADRNILIHTFYISISRQEKPTATMYFLILFPL